MSNNSLQIDIQAATDQFTAKLNEGGKLLERFGAIAKRESAGVVSATDKISKSAEEMSGKLTSMGKGLALGLAGLGAGAGIDAIMRKVDSTIESMAQLQKASEQVGSSVGQLSKIKMASTLVGDDFETAKSAIQRLSVGLTNINDPANKAARALGYLGITAKEIKDSGKDAGLIFEQVAKKLEGFKDDASKTNFLRDVFGKTGAELNPVLHELATNGELVAKVTAEQAEAAENYEKSLRKLDIAKNSLYKTISLALLPSMQSFVDGMLNAKKEVGSLSSTVTTLAESNPIEKFADGGMLAIAALVDVIKTAGSEIVGMQAMIEQWIYTGEWGIAKLNAKKPFMGEDFNNEWSKKADEYEAAANEAVKRKHAAEDIWVRGNGATQFYDSVSASIDQRNAVRRGNAFLSDSSNTELRGGWNKKEKAELPSITHTSIDGLNAKRDPFTEANEGLQRQIAGLAWAIDNWEKFKTKIKDSQEAMALFDVESGKFSDAERKKYGLAPISQNNKSKYVDNAWVLDELKKTEQSLQQTLKFRTEMDKSVSAQEVDISKREAELKMLTMSAFEASQIKTIEEERAKVLDKINSALASGAFLTDAQKQAAMGSADNYAKRLNAVAEHARMIQRDPMTGVKDSFNSFIESSTNSAKQIESVLTGAFNKASDALATFVSTGKVNFRSLASSIVNDMLKMASQQAMGSLLSAIGGGLGIGTSSAAGLFGGFRAGGGSVDANKAYVVGENGPEILTGASGNIIPNHALRQTVSAGSVGGGGATFNGDVNVSVASNGSVGVSGNGASQIGNLGSLIGNRVREILIQEMRPGGMMHA